MARPVTLIDVCSGNLRSVQRAFEAAGGAVTITSDPDVIRRAERVVVPGQGAFGVFARELAARGLEPALREAIGSGRPFLGICLGLQILFQSSEEQAAAGTTLTGLGLLAGHVRRLAPSDPTLKVPHMGWNTVRRAHDRDEPLLRGVAPDAQVYFVHSFHAVPADPDIVALTADHGGPICAAIRKDNLFACQFHPEKSQAVGLQILQNFLEDRA